MGRANSKVRPEFLFLGNHLALDFLNTHPVLDGQAVELLPDFSALLRWFQASVLLRAQEAENLRREWGDSPRTRRTIDAVREFRERLRRMVIGWEGGTKVERSTVEELNELMARYPMRSRLKSGNSIELWFETHEPEDLFAPLAHSAAMLFANVDRSRVRKCQHCVGHFHDISKKGTRRWCSMQTCGNRAKVAAYAARRRAGST